MFALLIFPASHPASIVSVRVLNFCVRDGNRWTHTTINTNSFGWVLTHLFYVKSPSAFNLDMITHFSAFVKRNVW